MIETIFKDLKHSFRMFAQTPAFTLAAVAALTLGIGVNTAIFSVVNAVMLTPLNFPDPDRVVMLMNVSPQGSGPAASPAKFMHWRAQSDVLQDVSAFTAGVMNYTGGEFPEQLQSGRVSADFFRLIGAGAAAGRTFSADEDLPHAPKVVVLSKTLWQSRFAGDPNVSGRSIALNGEPYTIVGVLDDFDFTEFGASPQVWTPWQFDPNTRETGHYFRVAGRLKPGVTIEQANARLGASAATFREKFPTFGQNASFGVARFTEVLVRGVTHLAVRACRRRQPRAADCLRERGEPPARARDGPAARNRDPRGGGWFARPDRASTPDREHPSLAGRRRIRSAVRVGGHSGAVVGEYGRSSPRR